MIATTVIGFVPLPPTLQVTLAVFKLLAFVLAIVLLTRVDDGRTVRRVGLAVLLAAFLGVAALHADDEDFVIRDRYCAPYSPADWEWWANGCWMLPR